MYPAMADPKQDVLDMLKELAELTILDEGDPQSFRVRAYENAAHGIEAFAGDLGALDLKGLQAIENVGKSTAEKIRELLTSGKVAKLEALRVKHPASVVAGRGRLLRRHCSPCARAYPALAPIGRLAGTGRRCCRRWTRGSCP